MQTSTGSSGRHFDPAEFKDFDIVGLVDDKYDSPPRLLPVSELEKDLQVRVYPWKDAEPGDRIALFWVSGRHEAWPEAWHTLSDEDLKQPEVPISLWLPAIAWGEVREGEDREFTLGYDACPYLSEDWSVAGRRVVRIDRLAPGGDEGALARIEFPPGVEARGRITASDFDTHGRFNFFINGYTGQQLGDKIKITLNDGSQPPVTTAQFTVESGTGATPVWLLLTDVQTLFEMVPVTFTYQVTDRAGNVSFRSNAHDTLKLQLTDLFAAPVLKDGESADQLNYNALKGGKVGVFIPESAGLVLNAELALRWQGTTANGARLDPVFKHHRLVAADLKGFTLELDNALAAAALQGRAVLSYVITNGGRRHASEELRFTIVGTLELEALDVEGAIDDVLDPESVPQEGVSLLIKAYPAMAVGDQLTLIWEGIASDGETKRHPRDIPVTAVGDIVHVVEKALLLELVLGTLTLSYTLQTSGGVASGSAPRELRVRAYLQKPEVEKTFGEDNDQLDFHKDFEAAENVQVTVREYIRMAMRQQVRVIWVGPRLRHETAWVEVGKVADMTISVPRVVLMDAIGAKVSVSYEVKSSDETLLGTSDVFELTVLSQTLAIQPPVYLPFGDVSPALRVQYTDARPADRVTLRWQVEDTGQVRTADTQLYQDGNNLLADLDPVWVKEDKRKTVYVNFSVALPSSGKLQFSPVLKFKP